MSNMERHLQILRATKPNDPVSVASQPVGEACQWAVAEIARLRAALVEIQASATLQHCVAVAATALSERTLK
jgi:hypothetical protein